MKKDFTPFLLGKDLRSISRVAEFVRAVHDQESFDSLFTLLLHHERLLVMRAADAVEKITLSHPEFLIPHKGQLLTLLKSAMDKELKWHVALLVPRLPLSADEVREVWAVLAYWCQNPNESRIVRANSLQGLYDMTRSYPEMADTFEHILEAVGHTAVPSLQARMRKLSAKRRRDGLKGHK